MTGGNSHICGISFQRCCSGGMDGMEQYISHLIKIRKMLHAGKKGF